MSVGARRAAVAAVLGACLAGGPPALAAEGALVAQIAQVAQQGQPGDEPALSGKPPTKLSGDTAKSGKSSGNAHSPDTQEPAAAPAPAPARALAETGSDAGMLALAGFGLLGWGLALRLRVRDAA
jgi:hypothetical protein